MADFQNQKERIKEFINSIGMTNSSFEKSLNLSNGYINSMRKGLGYRKIRANIYRLSRIKYGLAINRGRQYAQWRPYNKTSPINVDGDTINIEMEKELKRLKSLDRCPYRKE